MDQFDVMAIIRSWHEYIELCVNDTEELKDAIRGLKKELDLRRVKYIPEEEKYE